MSTENKSLFDKAIDALTNRDEKEATDQAKAQALAAQREAATLRARIAAEKAAAARALAEKAAAEKVAAQIAADEKAAAVKAAATNAAAERIAAARSAAAAPKKGMVTTRSLRVRKDHNTSAEVIAGLVDGNEITILGTWSDGRNTWAKLENGWAAMVYNGETYIKLIA